MTKKGFEIEQIIEGETVAEVLDYVQYDPEKLMLAIESWVKESINSGSISQIEGLEFITNYKNGLYGYTYLEQ